MKAFVDPDVCIGCELCPSICPAVFRMEGSLAVAYKDPVPPEEESACREAAASCPVDAIRVDE